jgi:hypothetical protein
VEQGYRCSKNINVWSFLRPAEKIRETCIKRKLQSGIFLTSMGAYMHRTGAGLKYTMDNPTGDNRQTYEVQYKRCGLFLMFPEDRPLSKMKRPGGSDHYAPCWRWGWMGLWKSLGRGERHYGQRDRRGSINESGDPSRHPLRVPGEMESDRPDSKRHRPTAMDPTILLIIDQRRRYKSSHLQSRIKASMSASIYKVPARASYQKI